MAFQSVPLTASAFVAFDVNGQTVGYTLYFRKSGGYAPGDLDDLAADVDGWVGGEVLPIISNQVLYLSTTVRGLENEEDYVSLNVDHQGYGSVNTTPLPGQVTMAFKRLSGQTGRSARGRIYWVGLGQVDLPANENNISATSITAIVTALLEIATYVVTHGWIEVIVSRYHESMKRSTAQTLPVTDWTFTDNTVDTQRRRLH